MDWLTFISKGIDSLAWPIVTIVIFLLFKNPIISLIRTVSRLKYKDLSVEFEAAIEKAAQSVADEGARVDERVGLNDQYSRVLADAVRIAESQPVAAVLYVWNLLERKIIDAYDGSYDCGASMVRKASLSKMVRNLVERGIVTRKFEKAIHELRALRNQIVHDNAVLIEFDSAIKYSELGIGIIRGIDDNVNVD